MWERFERSYDLVRFLLHGREKKGKEIETADEKLAEKKVNSGDVLTSYKTAVRAK